MYSIQQVVKMLWTLKQVHNKFWPQWSRVSLSIRVQTTLNHTDLICFLPQYQRERKCLLQGASWKRHCVTHEREQRCLYSYQQRQISQSDYETSSNCAGIEILVNHYNLNSGLNSGYVVSQFNLVRVFKLFFNSLTSGVFCKNRGSVVFFHFGSFQAGFRPN